MRFGSALGKCVRLSAAPVVVGIAASASFGVGIETIYTKITGNPTSQIPGPVDLNGNPAVSEWKGIESLVITPGGSQWLIKGRTNLGSDLENIVVMGSGRTGSMFIQEGQHAPGGGSDERYEFFGSSSTSTANPFGRFDEHGSFAFAAEARVAASGTTAAPNGERVFLWNGTVVSVLLEQNDLYTGVFDTTSAPGGGAPGDETAGNAFSAVHLLNNGTFGFTDTNIQHVGFTLATGDFYNHALFHQSGGVDTVLNLAGTGTVTFTSSTGVPSDKFNTTPDGAHWMMIGTIVGSPSRNVLVRDGQVILQNGTSPGSGAPTVGTITNFEQLPNGHWFAWGTYAAQGGMWAVKDGAVVAKTGDPISTGSGEHWGSTIIMLTGNRRGDWVISGSTDAAAAANEVIELNGATVLAREGAVADLNNNGIDDDNAFLGRGSNSAQGFLNSMAVSDDGWVYFFCNIHDSTGADLGSPSFFGNPNGFFRVGFTPTSLCGSADFNHDGDIGTDADIEAFFACLGGNCCATCDSADFNGDGDIGTDADIEAFFRVLGGGPC